MSIHLVTGGSGFVGSNIVEMLSDMGENVRVLDIIDTTDRPEGVEFLQGSILDKNIINQAIKDVDYIYHTIALVPLTKSGKKFWEVNVNGTQLLLNIAQQKKN